ncbi:MAG: DEAD/DEAH box helicase [Endomicrobiales bacterium]|nr:DEAD/DEAH box helicase [Endomicrobiales bacterium]
MMTPHNDHPGFYGLNIAPGLLEVIKKLGFKTPTPIQAKAIPTAIEGKDIIGVAQTGTGKTIAFGIPMIQRLAQKKGRGLVLVPTRELAIQVNDAIKQFAPTFGLSTVVLIGGESMMYQALALRKYPRIIIATPGRLLDHISQQRTRLDDVEILVLDEADRMLDMGFAPQINRILSFIPRARQTMLFSATMPEKIVEIASKQMKLPVRTEIAPPGTAAEKVTQEVYVVKSELKNKLLEKLLSQYTGSILMFSRTKRGASRITRAVRAMGHQAAEIHSDRSLPQRKEALEGFKSGKYRILIATDIAARGIDVMGIELVLNYDLPDDIENYVHRIGRTGRAGHSGHAISIATPDQGHDVKSIEKLIKTAIPLAVHPSVPAEKFDHSKKPPQRHGYHGSPKHSHHRHFNHHRKFR